jgi:uncharacterized membrane protein
MFVLSLLGLADSLYLAKHKADGTPLLCNIENLSGCNVVANSPYSDVFGIPLADLGVLFYIAMLVLVCFEYLFSHIHARRALLVATAVGALLSLYFIFVQIFLIRALCIYCIGSAIIAFALLVCMVTFFKKQESPASPSGL